ncbi:unnamed protein product [Pleuronectes platessa]|uniref:Uncharacterized protein n=1 Tax=Pleuronectes platessa TaxID=8262 RepID=A0A9N7VRJ8_PLEPL|nr:unnamed protein product [Pleuronectes platessa]
MAERCEGVDGGRGAGVSVEEAEKTGRQTDEQTYSLTQFPPIPLLALCHAPSSPPELSLACQNQSQDAMLSASHMGRGWAWAVRVPCARTAPGLQKNAMLRLACERTQLLPAKLFSCHHELYQPTSPGLLQGKGMEQEQ